MIAAESDLPPHGGVPRRLLSGLVLAAVPLLATAYFYAPILDNYFFGDDLLNLYRIADWGFWRYVLTPYAGHVLVLRNAIFAACYSSFGPQPYGFFAVVLLTHLLNVYLLYRVVDVFTGSARLACFGAVLWGVSPLNEGTIGWYSVYGQALVATGALWLLWRLGRVARGAAVSGAELFVWAVVVVAISTLFGTGTGVAMSVPIAAWLILPKSVPRARPLLTLAAAGVAVPCLYFALQSAGRTFGFGLSPSLSNVLPHWRVVVDLFAGLLGRGAESLFLGRADISVAVGPARQVVALFAALVAAAAWRDTATRRLLLACLGLAGSGYFMIALGRGAMVARGMRAELVLAAERYHYLGPLFLAVALCVAVALLARPRQISGWAADLLLAAVVVATIAAHASTRAAIDTHRFARTQTVAALEQLRAAIAAAPGDGDVYIRLPDRPFVGVGPMLVGKLRLFPSWAGVFVVFFPDNVVDGRRVVFVTDDPRALRGAETGRRSASLLVAPPDVPAGQPVVDL